MLKKAQLRLLHPYALACNVIIALVNLKSNPLMPNATYIHTQTCFFRWQRYLYVRFENRKL